MAKRISAEHFRILPELRYQPTEKRVRANLGAETVVDSRAAVLVWEPGRILPHYAVPAGDLRTELLPAEPQTDNPPYQNGPGGIQMIVPSAEFRLHSADGEPLTIQSGQDRRESAAFRLAEADLEGHVLLDFAAFDWWEEDERIYGHPRDPFHRVDIRPSSGQLRVEHGGQQLAESSRFLRIFETNLPVALYVPSADINWELLTRSTKTSICPYKGHASYWSLKPVETGGAGYDGGGSADGDDGADIAWAYENPLPDSAQLAGHLSFYAGRVNVTG
ncbi:DUF427 domain-containing protein [Arthrobacter sp. H14]|uniref:DUF427 domain-containing protein n=1 Tax=Arthrobacter sp. H14 TaxID=1312959 RepID=UPI0006885355|nr:DUF427 domain-containing protein [Arthrobacter sp. H14]